MLQSICIQGEFQLELFYAQSIADCTSVEKGYLFLEAARNLLLITLNKANKALQAFPYLDNYFDLIHLELNNLAAVSKAIQRVIFIGSGPLPLTSLCFSKFQKDLACSRISFLNIDRDPQAIRLSQAVCTSLGETEIEFRCEDANWLRQTDLSVFDLVFLGAAVGNTSADKLDIVSKLTRRMGFGARLIVRSTSGLKTLLYPVGNPQLWHFDEEADVSTVPRACH